jgi:twinkle protein
MTAKKFEYTGGSNLIQSKLPCPVCGSSDALAIYDDGRGFCYSHGKIVPGRVLKEHGMDMGGESKMVAVPKTSDEIEQFIATAKPHPLKTRHLTLASCKRWDYRVRRNPRAGGFEQLALYRDKSGRVVDVKVRKEDKTFYWLVGKQDITLYGQNMWGSGGKHLVITEGELDAITVSQHFDHKYPVVSVPGGAAGAARAITSQLEWVNSFDRVVFMFDMDEPGQEAAKECAALLAPGKAHIAWLPEKDPNDCLVNSNEEAIGTGFWNAKKFQVGGVVDARTLSIRCRQKIAVGRPWPWSFLNRWTFGKRPGEVYLIGSGVGMGKSDFTAEIVAHTIVGQTKDGVVCDPVGCGLFNYEAEDWFTKLKVAGKLASRRFYLPDMPEFDFESGWTEEEKDKTLEAMDGPIWDKGGKLFINEAGFSADWDEIVSRMRYLSKAEGIGEFVIDPVAAIVADMDELDERKFLDGMFREAASVAQELGVVLNFVSHLTRPKTGPSHEEGGHVALNQFRGSNGIGMFSNFIIGLERNQQADDPEERKRTTVRVVKDRLSSLYTGATHSLYYDEMAGTFDMENTGR